MTDPVLLSVRDLRVSFTLDDGVVQAVDGVSFDVLPGQVLGIVGESGCGKSVTMKAILQLVDRPGRVTQGEIRFRRRRGEVEDGGGWGDGAGTPSITGVLVVLRFRAERDSKG